MDPSPHIRRNINHLAFGCPSSPITVQSWLERGLAGQVRTEQVNQVSKEIPFSYLPCLWWPKTLLESWGWSSRIWRQAGTWAYQTVYRNLLWEIIKKLKLVKGTPRSSHQRVLRTFPLPVSLLQTKAHWFQPRWLSSYLLDLLTPLGYPQHSRWIRAAKSCFFSSLASYPYWSPLLSLGCYRPWRPHLSSWQWRFKPSLKPL